MNSGDSTSGEVLGTVGLVLNMTAVVAFALFLSTLGTTGAGLYGGAAVLAFLASLLCFAADRRRPETELIRRTRGAATMAEI